MPETSAREAEIAIEQQHVDLVYARLTEVRAETEALRDRGYELAHGAGKEAIFEQAQMLLERDVMVQHANKMLHTLDAEHEGLVFGRLDLGNATARGETLYIGRLGLRDTNFDNLVLDWRAPASAAFYQATAEEPMDVLRRRVIRCSQEKVLDIDDDVLTPDALTDDITVIGEGALMAALGRARGDTMRDIVATIQREQDEAIRAPSAGVTQITGGPGTGKTAVALHRAAYLLYRNRRQMTGAGVLVIGPSPVFTNYISRVLPSMGEDSVDLRALGEILDGETATHTDTAPVAVIKGSPRMLRLLRKATRQTPPEVPTELRLVYRGEVLKLAGPELEQVRKAVLRKGGMPNRSRVDAAEALLEALWRRAESYAADDERTASPPHSVTAPAATGDRAAGDRAGGGRAAGTRAKFSAAHDELVTELGERMEFHRFLVDWWPVLTPSSVLDSLGDRARLATCAGRSLTNTELTLLSQSFTTRQERGSSVADIALLDELRVLLGEPRRRRRQAEDDGTIRNAEGRVRPRHYDEYAHIVLDEAQDLSPMQWRMIGRRGRYASWTIVGDPMQSSWPDPAEAEEARDTALRTVRTRREFALRTNYRNSAEIFSLAADVLGKLATAEDLPIAVRKTGFAPSVVTTTQPELPEAARTAARDLLGLVDGTVGVITAMDRRDSVASWLASIEADRLRVVGSLEAKGLEYDGVLVIGPEEILTESIADTGRRALYVALTRATQRLTVLATTSNWITG
ncbi:MAG TPA: ATP-binding domain-containing protein [Pseudonocardiaceae bacterium]|nr:ATP-binding domain-containing protein [Pseudonocardiaceae bacterium]